MSEYRIHPLLEPLALSVDDLTPLPEEQNANRGDVEAIMGSLEAFGQRKPITARQDGDLLVVTAGNHTLEAAKRLGWESIAVVVTDDDERTAQAWGLADNRTGELGTEDRDVLADILRSIGPDPALLAATAFTDWEVAEILEAAANRGDGLSNRGGNGLGTPVVQYAIVFDDEAQQVRWYEFLRWLREQHPDPDLTNAGRLDLFLQGVME